jgi:hypothetical protein
MDIIFYFAALLTVTFAIVTSSLAQMHMFQLNSYSAVKHVRWMSKNYGMIFTHVISLLFAADALFPVSEKWQIFVYSLFAVLLAVFGFVSIPKKKAKKPLGKPSGFFR